MNLQKLLKKNELLYELHRVSAYSPMAIDSGENNSKYRYH